MLGLTARNHFQIIFSSLFLFILSKNVINYFEGGNDWKQGDWLINSELIPVRRGLFGSLILWIADVLSVSPLLMVVVVQLLIFTWIGFMLWVISRNFANKDARWLLFFIPGFFLTFWANDPQGSFRKELLLFASQASLVAAFIDKKYFYIGIIFSVFSFFGHEINILMAPSLFILVWLFKEKLAKSEFFLVISLMLIGLLISAGYTLLNLTINDYMLVCKPLLNRGLSEDLCGGSIKWLSLGSASTLQLVREAWNRSEGGAFIILYLIYSLVFICLAHLISGNFNFIGVLTLFYILTLPLYFVAIDYGRWMTLCLTSAVFYVVGNSFMQGVGSVELAPKILLAITFISILFTQGHVLGLADGRAMLPVILGYLLIGVFLKLKLWIGGIFIR